MKKQSKKIYAVKHIGKSQLEEEEEISKAEKIKNEVSILRSLDHPNVVKFQEVYETQKSVFLVFELLEGGSILQNQDCSYKIKEIRKIMFMTLQGILYLKQKGIVHMDIKPQNILLKKKKGGFDNLKIIDFGLARMKSSQITHACGTPGFIAPELLRGVIDPKLVNSKVDIFSLGMILHLFLFGNLPYDGVNLQQVLDNNRNGVFKIFEREKMITDVKCRYAFDLMLKMTQLDQLSRISVEMALEHPFFYNMFSSIDKSQSEIGFLEKAKKTEGIPFFSEQEKMRK